MSRRGSRSARLPAGERAATIFEGIADFRAVGKRTYQEIPGRPPRAPASP